MRRNDKEEREKYMIAHLPNNHIILAGLGREDLVLQLLGRAGLQGLSDGHLCTPTPLRFRKKTMHRAKDALVSLGQRSGGGLRRELWW